MEALADCTDDAYENDELVRVIFDKTKIYKNSLENSNYSKLDVRSLSLINTILQVGKPGVTVIDFGGAAGAHYFDLRKALPDIGLSYTVIETPAMVKYAQAFSTAELKFKSDFNGIENVDIVHSSGTLQSVDNPYVYLQKLINLKADYMLFNRLGFTLAITIS